MQNRILIIDDEPNITSSFASLLTDEGHLAEGASDAETGLKRIERNRYDLVLLDLNLPGLSGIDFLKRIKGKPTAPMVLVISGQSEIAVALEAMKLGAVDYLEKPVAPERLISSVRAALMLLQAERQRSIMADEVDAGSQMIGQSASMRQLSSVISQAAPTDVTVLIEGENGTGKELVATRIYLESRRRDRPFVKVNCPGIPETLFESELFGHRKGAFTGAVKDYPGLLEMADGGTLFLDEIAELDGNLQSKLLRVIQEKTFERVGGRRQITADVRLIAATNRRLKRMVDEGGFREDLFYRLNTFPLELPPLRERPADIPALARAFLGRAAKEFGKPPLELSEEAMECLMGYNWPGNVRELENAIERAVILAQNSNIEVTDLPHQNLPLARSALPGKRLKEAEKNHILNILTETEGNYSEAARILGISRMTLYNKAREYGINVKKID
ncbi:MAG: sigma-54-dependent Fis family transcriptional regulator, partial [candidate division Zixibacteria bacterium]|nr:sigma-54-dependent Fis family transcriptional regulator [candidate division Zixibacteria bacterium]